MLTLRKTINIICNSEPRKNTIDIYVDLGKDELIRNVCKELHIHIKNGMICSTNFDDLASIYSDILDEEIRTEPLREEEYSFIKYTVKLNEKYTKNCIDFINNSIPSREETYKNTIETLQKELGSYAKNAIKNIEKDYNLSAIDDLKFYRTCTTIIAYIPEYYATIKKDIMNDYLEKHENNYIHSVNSLSYTDDNYIKNLQEITKNYTESIQKVYNNYLDNSVSLDDFYRLTI